MTAGEHTVRKQEIGLNVKAVKVFGYPVIEIGILSPARIDTRIAEIWGRSAHATESPPISTAQNASNKFPKVFF